MTYRKYRNTWKKCHQGHNHPSKLEADFCDQLALLVRANEIKSYETQVSFDLAVKKQVVCRHIVDFVVTNNDGSREILETKGFVTPVYRIKRKLFGILYPKWKYEVITSTGRYKCSTKRKKK